MTTAVPLSVRLWQISDNHCYPDDSTPLEWSKEAIYPNQSLRAVLNHLKTQLSDHSALFITGDLAQEETAQTYQRIKVLLDDFPLPIHVLPGNHDIPELMRAHLGEKITLPSQVSFGQWHAILLDTHAVGKPDGHLDDAQFNQLEQQLRAIPSDEFAIILMHHHPIDIGSEWMDRMGLQQKQRFWEIVSAFNCVKAVFNGHIHQAFHGEYRTASGCVIPVFGTPATCIQLKPSHPVFEFDHLRPAWREIVLHPDGTLETEVHYLTL
jgi:Icc protein